MGWYFDYKPIIETDKGIKAKSKRGDFVKNWWASRWLVAMERGWTAAVCSGVAAMPARGTL